MLRNMIFPALHVKNNTVYKEFGWCITLINSLPKPISDELYYLVTSEFSPDQIGVAPFIVNLFVATLTFVAVRKIGPYAIDRYYIEPYRNVSRSAAMANVLYRVISPVIISEACYLMLLCLLNLSCVKTNLVGWTWLSVVMYWCILFATKIAKRLFVAPSGLFLEAGASTSLFLLFDASVVSRIPYEGFSVFDETNIGFQMLISIGFMLVYWITSLIVGPAGFGEDTSVALRERIEKALYGYLRSYEQIIRDTPYGKRFESDGLFKAIVLTTMYIEDHNRPKTIRSIENLLSYVGLCRTTGVMQCRMKGRAGLGRPYYTDAESVQLALPILNEKWEKFIRVAAMSGNNDSNTGPIWFTKDWYSFETEKYESVLKQRFSLVYGDYRGSKALDCNHIFSLVLDFVKNESDQMIPSRTTVSSNLFKELAQTYPDSVMTIRSGCLDFYGHRELEPGHSVIWSIANYDGLIEEYSEIIKALRKTNSISIDSMSAVDGVYYRVEFTGRLLVNIDRYEKWYKYSKPKTKV